VFGKYSKFGRQARIVPGFVAAGQTHGSGISEFLEGFDGER
jgi:hypothetical protein